MMFEAIITVDGIQEASVSGKDKDRVMREAVSYFTQYSQDKR